MKANRTARDLLDEERAQVGIGTMIVFIASVLVAAIAAAVLLDVSGRLQERSTRTGMEATQQVSSNLEVKSISGMRDQTSAEDPLRWLNVTMQLSPGSSQLDLSQVVIELSDGNTHRHLNYTLGPNGLGTFNATSIRDVEGTFSANAPVMASGDLTQIWIDMDANGLPILPRQAYQLVLIPEVGVHVNADFRSPASFGSDQVVRLR